MRKYCANSDLFSLLFLSVFLILIVLLKFSTKLKEFIAVSSIALNELKINKELINTAIKNIFESWLISSSYVSKPSVSIKKQGNGVGLWTFDIIKGSGQILIPFAQGLKAGPTPNPDFWFLFI